MWEFRDTIQVKRSQVRPYWKAVEIISGCQCIIMLYKNKIVVLIQCEQHRCTGSKLIKSPPILKDSY